MNKNIRRIKFKDLEYEVKAARVKDSVEYELQILDEEYDVIQALSRDGDLTPVEFGFHHDDIDYMRSL